MRLVLSVLAAALVVAGTGCSSDDDPDRAGTTAPAVVTRPEPPEAQSRWAKQVDEACRPWQERIDAVAPPADARGLERWLAEALPLVRKQVAAVRAVKPPAKESEADRAKLFLDGMTRLERSLTRYLAAIRVDDAVAVTKALEEANAAGSATRGFAVSVDVTECGGYEGS